MKGARFPFLVFGLLLIGYVVFLAGTIHLLPPQIATHFDLHGLPNRWMNRSSAVLFQGAIGISMPLVILAVFFSIRFVPMRWITFPRRDIWFAPECRDQTCTYLCRQGLWLATLSLCIQTVVWYQLVEANTRRLPRLSSSEFLALLAIFEITMLLWAVILVRHFFKKV